MSQPDPTAYRPSSQTTRKTREARAARSRLPVVWVAVAGAIALVFLVGFLLALLL
jgi:hypothetical protein